MPKLESLQGCVETLILVRIAHGQVGRPALVSVRGTSGASRDTPTRRAGTRTPSSDCSTKSVRSTTTRSPRSSGAITIGTPRSIVPRWPGSARSGRRPDGAGPGRGTYWRGSARCVSSMRRGRRRAPLDDATRPSRAVDRPRDLPGSTPSSPRAVPATLNEIHPDRQPRPGHQPLRSAPSALECDLPSRGSRVRWIRRSRP